MDEQEFANLRKANEAAIQAQEEMFWTVANFCAGNPDEVQAFQKKWADTFRELLKKQQEALEIQYQSGLKMIEEAFASPTVKNPEELRAKLIKDWKKNFESHRQIAAAQIQACQAALAKRTNQVAKWTTQDWWLTGG